MVVRKKPAKNGPPREPDKKKETLAESIAGFAAVFVIGLFIITFVMQSFVIPSSSMENTLLIGDHLFVDRLTPAQKAGYARGWMPYRPIKRGDVIVFVHPDPDEKGMYVVKRVIGIPGDRIHLHDGVVYRNGEALNEPYRMPPSGFHDEFRDEFPKQLPRVGNGVPFTWPLVLGGNIEGNDLVIPPDDYFAMGDNRENSLDSRYWGFIPRQNIVGRPLVVYWSIVTPPDQGREPSMTERAASLFHMIIHFFDETRWSRTLHRVQ